MGTNQNTNQQPSTCLHQTLTHQMRASLARSPTRSRTPPTTSPRPSRATRRLSKFLTLHTSPTTIIRRMHDGMELNAGPMATCDHINGVIIVSPRYLHTPMNEI